MLLNWCLNREKEQQRVRSAQSKYYKRNNHVPLSEDNLGKDLEPPSSRISKTNGGASAENKIRTISLIFVIDKKGYCVVAAFEFRGFRDLTITVVNFTSFSC